MKSRTLLTFCLALVLLASCAPPPLKPRPKGTPATKKAAPKTQKPGSAAVKAEPTPTPTPAPVPEGPVERAVFLRLHPEGNAAALSQYLISHPELHVTVLFPPQYFEREDRRPSIAAFRVLVSSQQIEAGLILDNQPILPLLGNVKQAEGTEDWKFEFKWPGDISAQIARASARYQRRWMLLPSGFLPPYGALSEDVMQAARQFRLSWVLAEPDELSGVRFYGGTAVLLPPLTGEKEADKLARFSVDNPFVYIDFSKMEDPALELAYLKALVKALSPHTHLVRGAEFIQGLHDEYALPKDAEIFRTDFSEWVRSAQQKRVWQALSEARDVLENYKDSGRANLKLLDAAVEEMCSAESGPFLLELGLDTYMPGNEQERTWSATMSSLYRLTGQPVPDSLTRIFAAKGTAKTPAKKSENDRPFFIEGPQSLTWNDPSGDDNGAGSFTYPSGKYPKGAFDLREVTVSWDDETINLSVGVVEIPWKKTSLVMPLADIYVDVNRLPGAGSSQTLKKRAPAILQSEAAWEYAVTLSADGASIYQSIPGAEPRLLKESNITFDGNGYSVALPRSVLRGDPRQWRLSVGLMGMEAGAKKESAIPAAIQAQATSTRFGGAVVGGRTPPPFMDLLGENSEEQARRISAYETGGRVIIPFVEAP